MKRRGIAVLALVMLVVLVTQFGADAARDVIVIGEIAALTGPTMQQGTQERNGCVLAVEEINAAGGLLGKQVKLVTYDSRDSRQKVFQHIENWSNKTRPAW